MDIADFLLARVDEDEKAARGQIELREDRYPGETYEDDGSTYWVDRGPWLYADPVRVLAECEAKRTVVGLYLEIRRLQGEEVHPMRKIIGSESVDTLADVLQILALPYADHPDYQPEWSPLANR